MGDGPRALGQLVDSSMPEGSKNSITDLTSHNAFRDARCSVALSFLYCFVRRVLEVVRVHRMDTIAKDAEILVLANS